MRIESTKGKMRIMQQALTIPYLIEESGRENPFTLEMERAAILCLSEAKRKKIGILSGGSERLSCLAEVLYPLWAVPWNDGCIIVDGLDITSSDMRLNEAPSVIRFIEDMSRAHSSFATFLKTLKRHSRTFRGFKSSRRVTLKGVVNKAPVLESLRMILEETIETHRRDQSNIVFASLIVSREEAEERARRFIEEWNVLNGEIDSLFYAIEVLNREVEHHKYRLSLEIDEIRRDYDSRISRTRKMVDKKVKSLVKEKEKAENKINKAGKRRLDAIIREKNRLKERIERFNLSLHEALEARKRQKSKYPKRSTTRIDNRIAKYRNDIRILKRKISELEKQEAEVRRETLRSLKEIEEIHQKMIGEELDKIEILEEARKLEVSEKSELISQIDRISSMIESQIRELASKKTEELKRLENKAVQRKIEETSLIGIPFYIAIFESPRKMRADIYPPMIARSYGGVLQRIKRIFSFNLESRMELLLDPRFPELNKELFLSLEKRINSSIPFRRMIFETGKANNLLGSPQFSRCISEGISGLEREGWIDQNEGQNIIEMYVEEQMM